MPFISNIVKYNKYTINNRLYFEYGVIFLMAKISNSGKGIREKEQFCYYLGNGNELRLRKALLKTQRFIKNKLLGLVSRDLGFSPNSTIVSSLALVFYLY